MMERNEVIAAIKKALLDEEKKLLTFHYGEWVGASNSKSGM